MGDGLISLSAQTQTGNFLQPPWTKPISGLGSDDKSVNVELQVANTLAGRVTEAEAEGRSSQHLADGRNGSGKREKRFPSHDCPMMGLETKVPRYEVENPNWQLATGKTHLGPAWLAGGGDPHPMIC